MFPIDSWQAAFVALHRTALVSRGAELDGVAPDLQAPRTIGADIVAIAAVFDAALQRVPYGFGGQALARRWVHAMLDVERLALRAPRAVYAPNRAFWNLLAATCVYLDAQSASLPGSGLWNGLLVQLGEHVAPRNVGPSGDGPFKHFDGVKTFDELFIAQLKHLRDLRGSDDKDPEPGMTGGRKPIPRTLNADVVLLADYWTKQLADVKRVMGAEGVEQRWKAALADIASLARGGDPNAVYAKNNAFWRALQQTAIHVAAADEAPSRTDLMLDAIKDSVTHIPENLKAGAKAIASGAADLAGSVAHGVGKIAHDAGSGLFSGFGTPLLVGAGLVGLFLISRANRHESGEG